MKLENVIAVRKSKVVYRDGDLAIKVFDENYSKADVLNEALNQARIEQTELHIPEIVEVTKIDGKWAIITKFIEGKTLEAIMDEEPEKHDRHLEFFVDLHLEVHRQQCPLLNKLKDKMHRQISMTDLDATTRYDLHTRLESMPSHKKVCHGDFNPSNIIIAKDGTPYILDWSHVTQGTRPRTQPGHTFSSGFPAILKPRKSISNCFAKRVTPRCSMSRNGSRW